MTGLSLLSALFGPGFTSSLKSGLDPKKVSTIGIQSPKKSAKMLLKRDTLIKGGKHRFTIAVKHFQDFLGLMFYKAHGGLDSFVHCRRVDFCDLAFNVLG